MKRLQRAAVLLSLIEAMKEHDSWCGETNIQKACYFLQELTRVPLGFEFILYKYGPYSFELTDELTALHADSILTLIVRDPRYGPSYAPGKLADLVKARFPRNVEQFRERISFVAEKLGAKGVSDLERLATALHVSLKEMAKRGTKERATQITVLKPHIDKRAAEDAVREVDDMLQQVGELFGENG